MSPYRHPARLTSSRHPSSKPSIIARTLRRLRRRFIIWWHLDSERRADRDARKSTRKILRVLYGDIKHWDEFTVRLNAHFLSGRRKPRMRVL